MVREFIYPTEYHPPVVEKGEDGTIVSATPATPDSFETREVGIVLGYRTRKAGDGRIEFKMDLKRTSFLGFVNYGTPIKAPAKGWPGREVTLTENRIEMPVFDMKSLQTGLLVNDGDFIAVGGFAPDARTGPAGFSPAKDSPPLTSGRNFVALIQVRSTGK